MSSPAGILGSLLGAYLQKGCFLALLFTKSLKLYFLLLLQSKELLEMSFIQIIKDLEEEIGELKTSIQTLRQSARDPRELIFADVLLHRPK